MQPVFAVWRPLTLLALLVFSTGVGACQQALSIDDAVRRAIETHPLLAARAEHITAMNALVTQAGLRPNPVFVIQSENWKWSGGGPFNLGSSTDQFAYANQLIETAGKRQRRVELGREEASLAALDRELVQKQIASRVKTAYWAAAGAERIRQLWEEHQDNFRQTITYHEIRVREGAIPEADLIRIRLEGDRFSVAAAAAALEAQQARLTLLREMGQNNGGDIRFATPLEDVAPSLLPDFQRAFEQRTEMKIARQEIERTQANSRLQLALARPDLGVLAGYKFTAGYSSLIGGIQVPLPVFNRNQGNIGAAAAEGRAARSLLRTAELNVRADVAAAQRNVESKRSQLQEFLAGSRQRAAESATIAGAAYREGGADLLRLLDAERVRIDLEVLYARTLMEYRQSLVALETALGLP